ncbi:butyrate kinase [Clostridium sp. D2Q-11]|uniref:Probable butyrate kinase n=1 Tax=Anaeromonas frigoriresistens TaxID=2683708 RepID=A0A942UUK0_9FIRM|nr:butyrate kinase [Anaeromonas frigoriresistens]MBS4538275.1 butyrate kinase [Anaeromonas frigoriresistens]
MSKELILTINPGSTSTKIGIFKDKEKILEQKLEHNTDELEKFEKITDQYEYRMDLIQDVLEKENMKLDKFKAVVGRGGLLRPMPAGTYEITDKMVEDLKIGIQGEHASNLGGLIAKGLGDRVNIPSYIVDPVAVDEFEDIARISGIPEIPRKSLLHALNIRAVSHRLAEEIDKDYSSLNLIVAHLGGGISVASIEKGRITDVNNANEMGPFSPERAGEVPVGDLAKLCFSGEYTLSDIKKKLRGKAGLVGYLGTNNAKEVVDRINSGDKKAQLIFNAMAYQIGKEIGKMAAVLKGKVDYIILTGGVAYSNMLTSYVKDMIDFIAPVEVYPGEDELEALNEGALRVLEGKEKAKVYEEEVNIND